MGVVGGDTSFLTTTRGEGVVSRDESGLDGGGGPEERKETNLLSTSNQNGAPSDTATVVVRMPMIFRSQS
jgi:hypothetical protein